MAGCNEKLEKLDEIIESYKDTKGCLMPILNESQKIFGCIPFAAQKKISEMLGIPMSEIYGVITFYSHFSLEPKGKNVVGVCMGTACYVKNAQRILEELEQATNAKDGKTSPDGKFTMETTRCIGACGMAPVATINKDVYGRLTVDQVEAIVAKY
jgi:NADH-quinone oxidoreductase subunit E